MAVFPGLDDPLIALSLLAIDPELKGVLIAGPPGTGKTTIARAAQALFPPDTPFVNIPLGCTIDRLVGGIDMERTREAGRPIAHLGLMAKAHNGVIYVDEINLLPKELLNSLIQGLMHGAVHIEREGISTTYPTRFVLIATYNPEEGTLPASVTERLAFRVWSKTLTHLSWRLFLLNKRGRPPSMPNDIVQRIARARSILPRVDIREKQIYTLCEMANTSGVEGNRAEYFAYRCAKANAALHLREPVTDSDLHLAMRMIYLSRMGTMPLPNEDDLLNQSKSQKSNRKQKAPDQANEKPKEKNHPENKEHKTPRPQDTQDQGSGGNQKAKSSKQSLDIPLEELEHFDMPTIQPTTTAGRKAGKHLAGLNLRRGRFVRSIPGDPRSGKIDLLATITAAYIQGAQFKGAKNKLGLIIKKEHYRIKQYRQQSGLLFLFAVDGSGSMAINNYGAAKGAAIALLEKAYVYRDQVAMLFFRRNRADLLLSPGSSLSKAYRVLKRIPAGGRTPTGKAILKCLKMTKKAKLAKEVSGVVLILFTDGRANQPIQPISEQQDRETVSMKELKPLCIELGRHLAAALVIDTKRIAYQNQNAKEIAQWLNAQYLYLPKASAAQISDSLNANMDLWRSL